MELNLDVIKSLVPKQLGYWNDTARVTFIDGTTYSGKSYINSLLYPLIHSIRYYNFIYPIVAASNDKIRKTIVPLYTNLKKDMGRLYDAVFENHLANPYRWLTFNGSMIVCMDLNPISDPEYSKLTTGFRFTSINIAEAKFFPSVQIIQAANKNLGMQQAIDEIALHKALVNDRYIKKSLITKPKSGLSDYMNLTRQTEIHEANLSCLSQFDSDEQKDIKSVFAARPRILLDSNPGTWGWLPQLFIDKKIEGKLLPKDLSNEYSYHFISYRDVQEYLPTEVVDRLKQDEQSDDLITKMYIKGEYIREIDPSQLIHPDWVDRAFISGEAIDNIFKKASEPGMEWRIGLDPAFHGKDNCIAWLILHDTNAEQYYLVECFKMTKEMIIGGELQAVALSTLQTLDMDIMNWLEAIANQYNVSGDKIATDCQGNKVAEHIQRFGSINNHEHVIPVRGSNPQLGIYQADPNNKNEFANQRVEMYWHFKELLKTGDIIIKVSPTSEAGRMLQRDLYSQQIYLKNGVWWMPEKTNPSPDWSDSGVVGIYGAKCQIGGRYTPKSYFI